MKKITRAAIKSVFNTYRTSLICFLLALSILTGGAFSYARYVSEGKFYERPGIGKFALSALVDDVSALTFTNMAFWGGLEAIGVSMNSLRTVSISVNNYELDQNGNKIITEVPLEYDLQFSAPASFASKLAIQLSDASDGTVLTPQLVLSDVIKAATAGGVFTAAQASYNGKEYIGTDDKGNLTTGITFDVSRDSATGKCTAIARGHNSLVITIEPFVMEDMKQTLYFRLWDVESQNSTSVTEEGGTLLPPLEVNYSDDIDCYRISVSSDLFTFPAGEIAEKDYHLTLAPTDALHDSHLGGYLVMEDNNGNLVQATSIQAGKEVLLSTVTELATSSNSDKDSVTLLGYIPNHRVGDIVELDLGKTIVRTTYTDIHSEVDDEDKWTRTLVKQSTKLYRKSGNTWSSNNISSSRATHRIRKELYVVGKNITEYTAEIEEIVSSNQELETTYVSADKTYVEQSGTIYSTATGNIVAAHKTQKTEYSLLEVTYYEKKSGSNWYSAESEFSSLKASNYPPSLIDSYTEELPPTDEDGEFILVTGDELTELKEAPSVAAHLQTRITEEPVTRRITYTANSDTIVPDSITSVDPDVSTDPFVTHLPSGIQKYYLATSYSKNYPFFVKIHYQQIQT